MNLPNEKILMVFTLSTPWEGYHRGPFIEHIASEIKNSGGYVLCLEPTILSIHTLIKYPKRIFKLFKGKYKFRKFKDNIYVVPAHTLEHILISVRFGFFKFINKILLKNQLNKCAHKIDDDIKKIALIVHRPELYFLKDLTNSTAIIYDCWDDFCLTSDMKNMKVKGNFEREKILAASSSIIITTSEKLYLRNKKTNSNTFLIENGYTKVKLNDFSENDLNSIRKFLSDVKKPIIGYVGNIKHWVDFDLLKYIILQRPDYSFVFAGSYWEEQGKIYSDFLEKCSNVFVTGYINYKLFQLYISKFDAGIIPFIQNEFMRSVNPNKFYEYIGTGLPVVSTDIGDLKVKYGNFAKVVNNKEDFLKKLDEIVNLNENELKHLKEEILKVSCMHEWTVKARFFVKLFNEHIRMAA